ncbi:MAG: translation initiation factor IF-2, partial [Bacteroidales bacterium]|nr:translation initiation factor IF-2 [Bacteroidales bacterium]
MTGTTKVVRLSKAAKEFNIGRDTIVSFLAEKGFVIDRNPNTKLTDEMFSLLTDEFYEDKQAMEAAAQRELEYVGKETISIKDDSFSKEEKKPEDNFQEELIITGVGISFPSPKADKKVEKTEEPKKKETVPEAEKQEPVKEETAAPVGKTIEKA